MNVASGSPKFLPLADLDDPSKGYVVDDVMFVKEFVDDPLQISFRISKFETLRKLYQHCNVSNRPKNLKSSFLNQKFISSTFAFIIIKLNGIERCFALC